MKSELKRLGVSPRSIAKLKRAPKFQSRPSRNLRDRANCKSNVDEDADFVSAAERKLIKDAIRRSLAEKGLEGPENSVPEAKKQCCSSTKAQVDVSKKAKSSKVKIERKDSLEGNGSHVKTPAPSVHPLHYQQSTSNKPRNLAPQAHAYGNDEAVPDLPVDDYILSDTFKQSLASAEEVISATVRQGVQGPLASSAATLCCKCTPSVSIDTRTPSKQHHGSSGSPSPGRGQSPRRSPRNSSSKDSFQASKQNNNPSSYNTAQSRHDLVDDQKGADTSRTNSLPNANDSTHAVGGNKDERNMRTANVHVSETCSQRFTTMKSFVPYLIPVHPKPVEVKTNVIQGFSNRTGNTIVNIISQSSTSNCVAKEPVATFKRILPKPVSSKDTHVPSSNLKPRNGPMVNQMRPVVQSANNMSHATTVNGVKNYIQILPKPLTETRRSSEGHESSFLKSSVNQFLARKSQEVGESSVIRNEKSRRSSESNLVELKELIEEPVSCSSGVQKDTTVFEPPCDGSEKQECTGVNSASVKEESAKSSRNSEAQADSSKEFLEVTAVSDEEKVTLNESDEKQNHDAESLKTDEEQPAKPVEQKHVKKHRSKNTDDTVDGKIVDSVDERDFTIPKKMQDSHAVEKGRENSTDRKPKRKYTSKKRRLAELEVEDAQKDNVDVVAIGKSSEMTRIEGGSIKVRKSDTSTDMNSNIIEKHEKSSKTIESCAINEARKSIGNENESQIKNAAEFGVAKTAKTNNSNVNTYQMHSNNAHPKTIDALNSQKFHNTSSICAQRSDDSTPWLDSRAKTRNKVVPHNDNIVQSLQHTLTYDINTPSPQLSFPTYNQSRSFIPNLSNPQFPMAMPPVNIPHNSNNGPTLPTHLQNPFHLVQSQQSFLINSSTTGPLNVSSMLGSQALVPSTPGTSVGNHGLLVNNPLYNHQVATAISMMRPSDAQALFASMLLSNQTFNQVAGINPNMFSSTQFHNTFPLANMPNPSNLVNYFTQDFTNPNSDNRPPAPNPYPVANPMNPSSFANSYPGTSKECYNPFPSYSDTKTHGTFVPGHNQTQQNHSMSTKIAKSNGCSNNSSTTGALSISTSQPTVPDASRGSKNCSLSPSSKTQQASALTPLRSPLKPNISATFLPSPKRQLSKLSPNVAKIDATCQGSKKSKISPLVDAAFEKNRASGNESISATNKVPFRPEQSQLDSAGEIASLSGSSSKKTCTIAIQTDNDNDKKTESINIVPPETKIKGGSCLKSAFIVESGVVQTLADIEVRESTSEAEMQSKVLPGGTENVTTVHAPVHRKRGRPPKKAIESRVITAQTSEIPHTKVMLPKLNAPKVFSIDDKTALDPVSFYKSNKETIRKQGIAKVTSSKGFRIRASFRENEKFSMDLQYISRAYKRWGSNTRDWLILQRHLMFKNTELTEAPSACGGIEIDIPQLLKSVELCGGFDWVSSRKRWDKVAEHMGAPKSLLTRFASKLESVFQSKLLDFSILSQEEKNRIEQMVDEDEDVHSQLGAISWAPTTTSLGAFRKLAENVFTFYTASLNLKSLSTRLDRLEALYWSLVYERKQHVTVQYAKVCSSIVGSGFTPKSSSAATNTDKGSGWNLINVPSNKKNFLKELCSRGNFSGVRGDSERSENTVSGVSGISTPFIKAAMLFSTEFITTDPQGLPFVEYLHEGTKIWYVFKEESIAGLWNSAKKIMPELSNTDLSPRALTKHNLMIPPSVLNQDGVQYDRIVQTVGDFLIVSPDCFYCSVSLDSTTISECCYFADNTWLLDEAPTAFRESRTDGVPLLFPLEELLFLIMCRKCLLTSSGSTEVEEGGTSDAEIRRVRQSLKSYIDEEKENREVLKCSFDVFPVDESEAEFELPDWSDCTCDVCEYPCFFSLLLDEDDETMYCLNHGLQEVQRTGNATGFKLIQNITNSELQRIFS